MISGEPAESDSVMIEIDVEPRIGKKGDYIAHAFPPPELTSGQLERPGSPRSGT